MVQKLLGYLNDWVYNNPDTPVHYNPYFKDSTSFFSRYHHRVNGKWDGGGPFQASGKEYVHEPSQSIQVIYPGNNRPAYTGSFVASTGLTIPGPPVLRDLGRQGPKFYKQAAPDNPQMGLANALYELKDVPDMLRQRFLDRGFKAMFDLNLAYQFGWKPLLRDMRNLYVTQANMNASLNQLLKDEGKPVRRRIRGEKHSTSTLLSHDHGGYPAMSPTFVTQCYGDGEKNSVRVEYVEEYVEWYSASYRYWLPKGYGLPEWAWRPWMKARLFGLNVTPGVVYDAIPWSWLVDWFSNAGDCVANLDHGVAERLITDYAYVMGTQRNYNKYTVTGCFKTANNSESVVTAIARYGHVYKRRIDASPFGFGLNEDDLTPNQIGIMASLAGSRR